MIFLTIIYTYAVRYYKYNVSTQQFVTNKNVRYNISY